MLWKIAECSTYQWIDNSTEAVASAGLQREGGEVVSLWDLPCTDDPVMHDFIANLTAFPSLLVGTEFASASSDPNEAIADFKQQIESL